MIVYIYIFLHFYMHEFIYTYIKSTILTLCVFIDLYLSLSYLLSLHLYLIKVSACFLLPVLLLRPMTESLEAVNYGWTNRRELEAMVRVSVCLVESMGCVCEYEIRVW